MHAFHGLTENGRLMSTWDPFQDGNFRLYYQYSHNNFCESFEFIITQYPEILYIHLKEIFMILTKSLITYFLQGT